MPSPKSNSSERSKSDAVSHSNQNLSEVRNSSPEDHPQYTKISLPDKVSPNLTKSNSSPTETSKTHISLPFRDLGRVSFHIRDRIAAIIANVTYTAVESIDNFTDNSETGKEFIKHIIEKLIYFKCQVKRALCLIGKANNCRSILATILVLLVIPLILLIFSSISFMFGISSITIAFFAIIFFIFFVMVSFILVPVILTISIFVGSLMLFLSLFSKSDTWIQIIVSAVSYYLGKKLKKFTGSFHDLEDQDKCADIDGKPPQFDLPMSHIVVDASDATDYKAVEEEKDFGSTELKDYFNGGENVVQKDVIIEDREQESSKFK